MLFNSGFRSTPEIEALITPYKQGIFKAIITDHERLQQENKTLKTEKGNLGSTVQTQQTQINGFATERQGWSTIRDALEADKTQLRGEISTLETRLRDEATQREALETRLKAEATQEREALETRLKAEATQREANMEARMTEMMFNMIQASLNRRMPDLNQATQEMIPPQEEAASSALPSSLGSLSLPNSGVYSPALEDEARQPLPVESTNLLAAGLYRLGTPTDSIASHSTSEQEEYIEVIINCS